MTALETSATQGTRAPGGATSPSDAEPPRTTLPPRQQRRRAPQPRPLTMIRLADVLAVIGALAAAITTTGIFWQQISPLSGIVGYAVVTWCLFVLYYAVLISFDETRVTVRDRVSAVVV